MNQPADLCKSNPGFTKFSLEFDRNQNQPSQIQPWIWQQTKFSLEFLKFSLEFTKTTPWICSNSALNSPKSDPNFAKIRPWLCPKSKSGTNFTKLAHQRHQVHVKPWMALVAVFILVKLMGAFVPLLVAGWRWKCIFKTRLHLLYINIRS